MELREVAVWAFSPRLSTIIVTLLVSILLPILIHSYLYRKARSTVRPLLLLLGPSNAGKTTLLTLLANGTASATQTSQESQYAECQLPSSIRSAQDQYRSENDTSSRTQPKFRVLDTPGHGKLRRHAKVSLTTLSGLKGIIFVVDSAAVSSSEGLAEAADYLHDVLLILQKRHDQNKTSKNPQAIPVLIAANKQDVFTSLPAGLVKSKLEQEIGRVRSAKSRNLLDSGVGMQDDKDVDEEQNWLGAYGVEDFTFDQMQEHDVDIEVLGGNAQGEDEAAVHTKAWLEWIGQNI